MNKKKLIFSIIILLIDQITKGFIQAYSTHFKLIPNIFEIKYIENTGAAWSILQDKQILLIVISIVMLVLVYSMMFSFENNKLNNLAFGILFGGIIGNLVDRILFRYVRDFISVGNFPIFNIADAAIVVGVLLLIISTIKGEVKNGINSRRKSTKN